MALRARIIRMWMEMHLIFLYIYIILAVAVFNNKFNNLHFWTRVPSGQASGMRQGRAWGSGSSFGRPWPSNTWPCPQIPGPARPCTTLIWTLLQYFGPKELLSAEGWDARLTLLPRRGLIPCYQSTSPKPIIFCRPWIHQFHLPSSSYAVQLLYKNDVNSFQHSEKRYTKLGSKQPIDSKKNIHTPSNNSISD